MNHTQILEEELSVSDDVLKETEQIKQLILLKFQETTPNFVNVFDANKGKETLFYKSFSIELEQPIFNSLKNIRVIVVNFSNGKQFSQYRKNFNFGGETTVKYEYILLTIFSFGNKIDEKYLNSTLYHEMHHIYQNYAESKSKVINFLYSKSLEILRDNTQQYGTNIKHLAQIIYVMNKMEIDANMQSLYQEITTDKRASEVLMSYENAINKWNIIKDFRYDKDWIDLIQHLYNIDFKTLVKYIDKNIKYFQEKKLRVFKRIEKEKSLNENIGSIFNRLLL